MDSHSSHETPEFVLLAAANHIDLFAFPSHMTHILQPLDVGVFRPWKHWHKQAILAANHSFQFDYSISSLFRDLTHIRTKTFKNHTIRNAFATSGIWPVNTQKGLAQMRIYTKKQKEKAKEIQNSDSDDEFSRLPETPKTLHETQLRMDKFRDRVPCLLSSPSAAEFRSIVKGYDKHWPRLCLTNQTSFILDNPLQRWAKKTHVPKEHPSRWCT